jgi:hypothetical protein
MTAVIKSRSVWLACVLGACLSGCFTSAADFQDEAEQSIIDAVGPELGVTFTNVTCDPPIDQDVGTRFDCSALDQAGGVWEFDNVIDEPGEFTVNISRRP